MLLSFNWLAGAGLPTGVGEGIGLTRLFSLLKCSAHRVSHRSVLSNKTPAIAMPSSPHSPLNKPMAVAGRVSLRITTVTPAKIIPMTVELKKAC